VRGKYRAGAVIAQRYRLDAQLGAGGMGEVWAATHTVTGRRVALKFLHAELSEHEQLRRRFLTEARVATELEHDHVVPVTDVFELDDETPVIVMDLCRGEPMSRLIKRRAPLEAAEMLAIAVPVAEVLSVAHDHSVVHRDLKPDNVFLVRGKNDVLVPMVLDFGIAKLRDQKDAIVTATGVTLGTPCYMAPEQAFAAPDLDARVDIWALGVVCYEALAGARPIEATSIGEYLRRVTQEAITPLSVVAPDAPAPLVALVMRMLERERDRRPEHMTEVVQALAAIQRDIPPPASWSWLGVDDVPPSVEPESERAEQPKTIEAGPLHARDSATTSQASAVSATLADGRSSSMPRMYLAVGALAMVAFAGFISFQGGEARGDGTERSAPATTPESSEGQPSPVTPAVDVTGAEAPEPQGARDAPERAEVVSPRSKTFSLGASPKPSPTAKPSSPEPSATTSVPIVAEPIPAADPSAASRQQPDGIVEDPPF